MLIIDASREFKTGRAQNELLPDHVERIYGRYRAFEDAEGVARVVTLDEIASNGYNLNIPRYVEPPVARGRDLGGWSEAASAGSAEAAFESEAQLVTLLRRQGFLA